MVNGYAVAAGLETAMLADIRIVERGAVFGALERAMALAKDIAALPQGAMRTDKETVMRNVGRPLEERFRNEMEATISMSLRKDTQDIGARAFKEKKIPEWPNHGL